MGRYSVVPSIHVGCRTCTTLKEITDVGAESLERGDHLTRKKILQ
jgi:hypothetical protein